MDYLNFGGINNLYEYLINKQLFNQDKLNNLDPNNYLKKIKLNLTYINLANKYGGNISCDKQFIKELIILYIEKFNKIENNYLFTYRLLKAISSRYYIFAKIIENQGMTLINTNIKFNNIIVNLHLIAQTCYNIFIYEEQINDYNLYEDKIEEQEKLFEDNLKEQEKLFEDKIEEQEKLFKDKIEEQEKLFKDKLEEQEKLFKDNLKEQEKLFKDKIEEQEKLFKDKINYIEDIIKYIILIILIIMTKNDLF